MAIPRRTSLWYALVLILACGGDTDSLTIEDLPIRPYYESQDACRVLGIISVSGRLSTGGNLLSRGPCGAGSVVECTEGECRLVCTTYNGSDTTGLLRIKRPDADLTPWVIKDVFQVEPVLVSSAPEDPDAERSEFGDIIRESDRRFRASWLIYQSQADCEYIRALRRQTQ